MTPSETLLGRIDPVSDTVTLSGEAVRLLVARVRQWEHCWWSESITRLETLDDVIRLLTEDA